MWLPQVSNQCPLPQHHSYRAFWCSSIWLLVLHKHLFLTLQVKMGKVRKRPCKGFQFLFTHRFPMLGKYFSPLGLMSRVRSETIPSFPGLEEAKPTCAVGLLPHVEWIEFRVRFPQGWMQDYSGSPRSFPFCVFSLLAKYLDGAKTASEFITCAVACDTCYEQGDYNWPWETLVAWLYSGIVEQTKMTKIWSLPYRNSQAYMSNFSIGKRSMKWIRIPG